MLKATTLKEKIRALKEISGFYKGKNFAQRMDFNAKPETIADGESKVYMSSFTILETNEKSIQMMSVNEAYHHLIEQEAAPSMRICEVLYYEKELVIEDQLEYEATNKQSGFNFSGWLEG